MLGVQFFPFIGLGGEFFQFVDVPLQALALLLALRLALLGVLKLLPGLAPIVVALAQFGAVNAGIGIEQAAHAVGVHQVLPGVLAVDVHQLFAHLAQLRGGGGLAVNPGAAAALGVDGAAQGQRLGAGQFLALQPGGGRGVRGEDQGDFGLLRPFAHHAGIGTRAQGQLQGIEQNGFASARLAGQGGKAGGQIQVQRLHDDKVAQRDAFECHGR